MGRQIGHFHWYHFLNYLLYLFVLSYFGSSLVFVETWTATLLLHMYLGSFMITDIKWRFFIQTTIFCPVRYQPYDDALIHRGVNSKSEKGSLALNMRTYL